MDSPLLTAAHLPAAAPAHHAAGHWRRATHLDDLRDRADAAPDGVLLVDRSGGDREEIPAAELAARVQRVAEGLQAAGVRPREAVAYQIPNRWEAVALFLACGRIGAVAVPMASSLGSTQLEERLRSTGAVLAVGTGDASTAALGALADRLPELRVRVALDAGPVEGVRRFHGDLVPGTADGTLHDPGPDEIGADDVAVVLFTSGTTGRSKAVLHTANTLWVSARTIVGHLVDDVGTVRVCTTSVVTHVLGILTSVIGPVCLGRPAVLTDARGPAELLDLLSAEHVTDLWVGPTGLDAVLDALARGASRPASLRTVALGGAPIAPAVREKAGRLPAELRVHWGMTEVPGGGAWPGHEAGTSWHTLGHARLGLERRRDAGDGEAVGEVVVRGPQVTVGIADSGDGSAVWSPRDDDGWFRTGDLAGLDETGELEFAERDADEIKGASGMIIPTAEVEDLLGAHPDVSEAVLVAFHPDAQSEAPAAVVVAQPGREVTLDELHRHLLERGTTSWYLPQRLVLVASIDRDAAGKVDKRRLRAALE